LGKRQEKPIGIYSEQGGLVFQGAGIDSVYPKNYKNFSPRWDLRTKPREAGTWWFARASVCYFDTPNLNPFPGQPTGERRSQWT